MPKKKNDPTKVIDRGSEPPNVHDSEVQLGMKEPTESSGIKRQR